MEAKVSRQYLRFAVGFGVLLLVVLSFWLYSAWPILTGTTVILDTTPVDPFDPLRGQYMTIRYEINSVDTPANVGETVYVGLASDSEGVWRATEGSLDIPKEGVFIRGTVERKTLNGAFVKYGIEQFFFEKSAEVPTQNITVEAKVSSSGRAGIVQLLQNGQPVEIEYKSARLTS